MDAVLIVQVSQAHRATNTEVVDLEIKFQLLQLCLCAFFVSLLAFGYYQRPVFNIERVSVISEAASISSPRGPDKGPLIRAEVGGDRARLTGVHTMMRVQDPRYLFMKESHWLEYIRAGMTSCWLGLVSTIFCRFGLVGNLLCLSYYQIFRVFFIFLI